MKDYLFGFPPVWRPLGLRVYHSPKIVRALTRLIAALITVAAGAQAPATNGVPPAVRSAAEMRAQWDQTAPAELRKLAEAGNAEAAYVLGLQEMEKGREAVEAAFSYVLQAEPQGPVFKWEEVLPRWKDVPRDELMKAVTSGNREAQDYFGRVGQDAGAERERQGFSWIEKAAAHGLVSAQFDVGMAYGHRHGVVVVDLNLSEAGKWLRRAAEQDHEPATHQLADFQLEGLLGQPDLAEALKLIRRCVDQGCHRAEYQLAMLYANGNGEPRNDGEASILLLRKSSAAGTAWAAMELGRRYQTGFGVSLNPVRAAQYYLLASAQGSEDVGLQSRLMMVSECITDDLQPRPTADRGTARLAEALAAIQRARLRNDAHAMLRLGELELNYGEAQIAKVNAYVWFSRAADQGVAAAQQARDSLRKEMTQAELETAMKRLTAQPGLTK